MADWNRDPGWNRDQGANPDQELHPDDDLLLDVALGQADLPTRHDAGTHLVVCARCRVSYDQLAGAIEQLLPAIPRVAPPPDFEETVLARLAEQRRAPAVAADDAGDSERRAREDSPVEEPSATAGAASARRAGWRRWLVPVAAGLVGLAGGAGLTAVVLQDPPAQSVSATTPIVTGDGTPVGSVTRTIAGGEPALVVTVDDGPVGRSYTCRLVLMDGSLQDVGEWQLQADGVNSWVVPDPGVRRVELLAESGGVWSSADL